MPETMCNGEIKLDRYGYTFKGEKYQRVTTIKGMVNTGSVLIDWAARCVFEDVKALAEKFRDGKIKKTDLLVSLLDEQLAKAHNKKRELAADFGTVFHQLVDDWGKGEQDALHKLPKEDQDLWKRAEHFAGWCDEWRPEWLHNEFTVFSRKYHYAGTCDAIARLGSTLVMIDVKTSKAAYSEFALQMVAYRYAEFVGHPDGKETKVPDVDCCAVLLVRPEKCELVELECGPRQFEAFLACHNLYWWKRNQPDAFPFQPRLKLEKAAEDAVAGAIAKEVADAVFA